MINHTWKLRTVIILFIVGFSLTACSKAGNEYLGKWQNTVNSHDEIEIVRNGDNFLIKVNAPTLAGKYEATTVPAILKDGILEVQGNFLATSFTYVKATDTLTTAAMFGGNVEYRRK